MRRACLLTLPLLALGLTSCMTATTGATTTGAQPAAATTTAEPTAAARTAAHDALIALFAERTRYIGTLRGLARQVAQLYLAQREKLGFPLMAKATAIG